MKKVKPETRVYLSMNLLPRLLPFCSWRDRFLVSRITVRLLPSLGDSSVLLLLSSAAVSRDVLVISDLCVCEREKEPLKAVIINNTTNVSGASFSGIFFFFLHVVHPRVIKESYLFNCIDFKFLAVPHVCVFVCMCAVNLRLTLYPHRRLGKWSSAVLVQAYR